MSVLAAHDDDYDTGPYVCPGCYAVGEERCALGCIDEQMRRDREEERDEDYCGYLQEYDEDDFSV